MSNWLVDKIKNSLSSSPQASRSSIPEGLWKKCLKCNGITYRPELDRNSNVCPKCQYHMRLPGRMRLEGFLDEGERFEIGADLESVDLLKFKDSKKYKDRLAEACKKTGEKEALVAMAGQVHGLPLVAVAFDFNFMAGSMGAVVGEKFAQAGTYCLEHHKPLVCFSASGGARMQEALMSLMQMAKTSAVLAQLRLARLPYISVLTDPSYGGVSASLAMLGDINIAEPGAAMGFAGPRVIKQTVRKKLPEGFQRSEFLLAHGAIDMIVERPALAKTIARLLRALLYHRSGHATLGGHADLVYG